MFIDFDAFVSLFSHHGLRTGVGRVSKATLVVAGTRGTFTANKCHSSEP